VKSASRRAVVNLARNEAEFFFPFDTRGDNWTWFRKASNADAQEYHWDVFVPGDYMTTLFLKKDRGDTPGKGDFKSLPAYTEKGVRWAKPGEDFGEVDATFPLEIEPTPEPEGSGFSSKARASSACSPSSAPKMSP
jgi:hypothetical protein